MKIPRLFNQAILMQPEWIIIFLFFLALGGLLYTAFVVMEEDAAYRDNAREIHLGHFRFLLPSWWKLVDKKEDAAQFCRNDVKLDWFAGFKILPHGPSIEKVVQDIVEKKNIVFDRANASILTTRDFGDRPEVRDGLVEIARIEGTATEKEDQRIYYDIFLFKDNKNKQVVLCESKSSVLNGMIEGPYFEKAVINYRYYWQQQGPQEKSA